MALTFGIEVLGPQSGVLVVMRRKGDVMGVQVGGVGNAEVRNVRPERKTAERNVVFMMSA